MSRDNGRQKVYDAEFVVRELTERGGEVEVFGTRLTIPVERRFANLASIQEYVDKILALNWVKETWPDVGPVSVEYRKGVNYATYRAGVIKINDSRDGKWALREIVVLHELAHHLSPGGHGVEFRANFLSLVEEIIGPEIGWLLRMEYLGRGLPVQKITKVESDD